MKASKERKGDSNGKRQKGYRKEIWKNLKREIEKNINNRVVKVRKRKIGEKKW